MRLLSVTLFFLIGVHAHSSVGQLSAKAGTWSFTTENVRSESESSSGMGAYAFEIGYSFSPKWMLSFGVNLVMSDLIQGSSGYGLDLGAKYFPISNATKTEIDSEQTSISIRETLRPYVGVFMRQRVFGLAISTSYLGPGFSAGLDYSVSDKWLLNIEYRYDTLFGQGEATAVQNNILIGLGLEF